jgi:hypothetical protein
MLFQLPKGLLFTKVGEEPYTRKDGSLTTLAIWNAPCAHHGCPDVVVVKTPLIFFHTSKSFLCKHCPRHKLTPQQRQAAAKAARRLVHSRGNTKLSDADVFDIRHSKLTADQLSLIYPVSVRHLKEVMSGRRR